MIAGIGRGARSRAARLMTIGLLLAACGGDSSVAPPAAYPSLSIEATNGDWYPGDVTMLRAIVRDASGAVVPDAPITWSVDQGSRAEVSASGVATFLAPGAVTFTARSGTLAATRAITVRPLVVQLVTVNPSPLRLDLGGIGVLGVRLQGVGGRDVLGRPVTLSSDNPEIASIDAAGRVHANAPGITTVRATADGVSGTTRVEVSTAPTTLLLSRVGGARLPLLVYGDTVSVDGELQYTETFIEGGELLLTGAAVPRYNIVVRYASYLVTGPDGARRYELVNTSREHDFGVVTRDARGDLRLTSEYYHPLHHAAVPVADGAEVRYRIPGTDEYLDLLYRREP